MTSQYCEPYTESTMQQHNIDSILQVLSRLIDQYHQLASTQGNETECKQIDLKIHAFHKLLQSEEKKVL